MKKIIFANTLLVIVIACSSHLESPVASSSEPKSPVSTPTSLKPTPSPKAKPIATRPPSPPKIESWPTKAHDNRRTSQSSAIGPTSVYQVVKRSIPRGLSINMAPVFNRKGHVFFGTWGAIEDYDESDREKWDKSAGRFYAWRWTKTLRGFESIFDSAEVDLVRYCYDFKDGSDPFFCNYSPTQDLSWWNGTIEGTPVLSPDEKTVYVGRGDGKVYAFAADSGKKLWVFQTCNTTADCNSPSNYPEAGGEVVGGLLLRATSELYFGTFRLTDSSYEETTAFYRLNASTGELVWRYPQSGSLEGKFLAAPALSPDEKTIYAATLCDDVMTCKAVGSLYAFSPNGQVKWSVPLLDANGRIAGAWTLAVGSDGTIFVGGGGANSCDAAFVSAFSPQNGALKWGPVQLEPGIAFPCANRIGGLALREINGKTIRLYATNNFVAEFSGFGQPGGGRLFALDPKTGNQSWGKPFFDPANVGGFGNAVYPTVDLNGNIYFGTSGAYAINLTNDVYYKVEKGGKVISVSQEGKLRWNVDLEGGVIGYSHPVLGGDGVLYIGDMRDRIVDFFMRPLSDIVFTGIDAQPTFYGITDKRVE